MRQKENEISVWNDTTNWMLSAVSFLNTVYMYPLETLQYWGWVSALILLFHFCAPSICNSQMKRLDAKRIKEMARHCPSTITTAYQWNVFYVLSAMYDFSFVRMLPQIRILPVWTNGQRSTLNVLEFMCAWYGWYNEPNVSIDLRAI